MNILIIGSGGREHAIAWKVAQSPLLDRLFALPGNPGIGQLAELIPDIKVNDHPALIDFCKEQRIDLVLVGPEVPLADGIVDDLEEVGIHCFGPRKAAAQIEASKVFSKNFMARHGIPTAQFASFTQFSEAVAYLDKMNQPVVIKASGLAAGKGVFLPKTNEEARDILREIMVDRVFGPAGSEVVIEERMSGAEVSLMAFCDGMTVQPMLPAQDHKRMLDGDLGPNTGGMGAYAPTPILTAELLEKALKSVLKPAVNGLRLEGTPFVGVLYAGLMLTPTGIRVLEFNCRFGDPETQAVLPLLKTDLVEIAMACVEGCLADVNIQWNESACACVVLASQGYPDQPEIGKRVWFDELPGNMICFHAGTRAEGEAILTSGGRVLGLTAWSDNIQTAVKQVYENIGKVRFEGMQYRTDIAHHVWKGSARGLSYEDSGVNIDAGNKAVEMMKSAVQATYTPAVLAGIGSFGGLLDASSLKKMRHPVLVASTDGVGTKVKLASAARRYHLIGKDIVNHCINDILVQGGKPLFFMDYFATDRLNPENIAEVVTGIAEACQAAGMVLLGGETAEMPGVYAPGEFDVAGTIVGVLEKEDILPRSTALKAGNVLVGLQSSGPHTNGYSLIRKVFSDTPLDKVYQELNIPLVDALLVPHRSYLQLVYPHLAEILALAHITGGGFIENIPRILPPGLDAIIHQGAWPLPPLWRLIQDKGEIQTREMYRVFNMGIGMVAILEQGCVDDFQRQLPEETYIIGELVTGSGQVQLI